MLDQLSLFVYIFNKSQISSTTHSLTLTGNSGKILDTNGAVVFEIAATLMTISEHRTLKDASGNKIGQARKKKTPGLHMTYYLGPMDDEKKCAVKAKG
jgi:uncharacterized protein YxjI